MRGGSLPKGRPAFSFLAETNKNQQIYIIMKAILYFVAAGVVLPRHTEAAAIIGKETGKRVVFRNSDTGHNEKPEANEGVAGNVPDNYGAFTKFNDSGKTGKKADDSLNTEKGTGGIGAGQTGGSGPAGSTERAMNTFGVPDEDGAPTDRDSLKESLTAEGVEFHGNAPTDKLIALYMAHFYPEG